MSVRFPNAAALTDVGLTVDAGERIALVGPSGSGKTTLLRLLNGMARPSGGKVEVFGTDVAELSNRALRKLRSRIGFVPQDHALVPNLRVSQNVLSGRLGRQSLLGSLKSFLLPSRAELGRAHALLARVGIPEKLFERTDQLSGGQRQRVAVARSLMQDPAALLADEPVSSVDPARARDTIALLTEISRERGLTLVMSLHHLELAKEFFPRLVGLRRGGIAFDRKTEEIRADEFDALYQLEREELLADGA